MATRTAVAPEQKEEALPLHSLMGRSFPSLNQELETSQNLGKLYSLQNSLESGREKDYAAMFGVSKVPKNVSSLLSAECGNAVEAWEKLRDFAKSLNPDAVTKKQFEKLEMLYADALRASHNFGSILEATKSFYTQYQKAAENLALLSVGLNTAIEDIEAMQKDDARRHLVSSSVYKAKLEEIREAKKQFSDAKQRLAELAKAGSDEWFKLSRDGVAATPAFLEALATAHAYSNFNRDVFQKSLMLDVA
ncbi:MAG: hypothetical protein WCT31_04240, partial [Candidatus Micrarchaeia archaeon]